MSRGLSGMQRSILEILDEKHGMTSTRTLKTALQQKAISNQSFYRSLQSLEKRG
jgi:Fe2+ or Zn2+ uptake regulation protein